MDYLTEKQLFEEFASILTNLHDAETRGSFTVMDIWNATGNAPPDAEINLSVYRQELADLRKALESHKQKISSLFLRCEMRNPARAQWECKLNYDLAMRAQIVTE